MADCDEMPECPLCMEMFELDDLNFFPCTCGYQICRFCWHRIRTNENGLCPACRKEYPEDPAQFKPLADDEVHRLKKDWRQKESQRKQKSAESRKHLANVRVLQKNLVFVVGLSQRLTDPDTLKRHEYFGKFGRIHKVVINQSTSYVGSQGPSASAYVTYYRPEDALSAIRVVNNLQIEGRTLKASLGTTKYCSHFLKGTQCTKTDCMYLHDYGDEMASFTKEDIQQGKHLQYEQRLHEQYCSPPGSSPPTSDSPDPLASIACKPSNKPQQQDDYGQLSSGDLSPVCRGGPVSPPMPPCPPVSLTDPPKDRRPMAGNNGGRKASGQPRESPVPLLNGVNGKRTDDGRHGSENGTLENGTLSRDDSMLPRADDCVLPHQKNGCSRPLDGDPGRSASLTDGPTLRLPGSAVDIPQRLPPSSGGGGGMGGQRQPPLLVGAGAAGRLAMFGSADEHLSLFSDTGFPSRGSRPAQPAAEEPALPGPPPVEPEILETMAVKSSTDWQEAFGFPSGGAAGGGSDSDALDDDLGFDPWDVSARGLADMMENERVSQSATNPTRPVTLAPPAPLTNGYYLPPHQPPHVPHPQQHNPFHMPWAKLLPPGYTPNGLLPSLHPQVAGNPQFFLPPARSKMLNLMQQQHPQQQMQQLQQQQQPLVPQNNLLPQQFLNHMPDMFYNHQPVRQDGQSYHPDGNPNNLRQNSADFNTAEWQQGFRALLPNINISFGSQSQPQHQGASGGNGGARAPPGCMAPPQAGAGFSGPINGSMQGGASRIFPLIDKNWCSTSHSMPDLSFDPAILNTGGLTDHNLASSEEPPHWMASLQHLTDDQHTGPLPPMHPPAHLPPWINAGSPPPATRYPPPGFQMSLARQNSEPQSVSTEPKQPSA